jgi:putative ABC transport system permease protein
MKLAWHNMMHDRMRLLVTVMGIAFAVCLMIFQGSLLSGFLHASAKLIDSTQSDLWITARGVTCFDFPAAFSKRFSELSRGIPGIRQTTRIATSMVQYRRPDGTHQVVTLVGADPNVGPSFPIPYAAGGNVVEPDGVLIDRTSEPLLGVGRSAEIEINKMRAHLIGEVEGFGSFIGTPYVFASYTDAARYIGLRPEEAMYILLRLNPGYSPEVVKRKLQERLPEVDVLTRTEFARRSQIYWISQTGAGGGIMAAAILGFLVGMVIVSQTIYATTMENLEEFATLKALGASRWYVIKIVLTQALICGVIGCGLGVAATFPLVEQARKAIPWIQTPWWLPAGMMGPSLLMCCGAAIASIRAALTVEPGRVFRA